MTKTSKTVLRDLIKTKRKGAYTPIMIYENNIKINVTFIFLASLCVS